MTISILQKDLNNVSMWFNANKLKLNISKTQFIVFGTKNMLKTTDCRQTLKFRNEIIVREKSVKYLGLVLDETLSYNDHCLSVGKKIHSLLGCLRNIRYLLPFNIRRKVYESLVLSHFLYGITIWSATSNHNCNYLQVCLNKFVEMFLE